MLSVNKRLMRTISASSVVVLGAFALAACSSGSDPNAGGGEASPAAPDDTCTIANDIVVAMVNEQSGPVSYAGIGPREGAEVAIKEINESSFLGDGVELSLTVADSAGETERASAEMTKMLNNPEVMAIIGPASSGSAAAVAPAVGKSEVPTLFTQAGSEGVVINDWTFRITPPTETYYRAGVEWLAENGFETAALIYNGTFPTFAQMGQGHIPEMAKELGIEIVSSQEVQSSTQDFASQAQVIASANPEAVIMLILPAPSITFLSQLRDAGYTGQILATPSQSGGTVAEGGPAVDGIVYPVAFSAAMTDAGASNFVELFGAEFDGRTPTTYHAEGYDAIWWIANAIKESGCSTREGIQEGLMTVGAAGFLGAQGQGDLRFENGNDVRVDGTMVTWSSGVESLVD